jgi:hypothetical protein
LTKFDVDGVRESMELAYSRIPNRGAWRSVSILLVLSVLNVMADLIASDSVSEQSANDFGHWSGDLVDSIVDLDGLMPSHTNFVQTLLEHDEEDLSQKLRLLCTTGRELVMVAVRP